MEYYAENTHTHTVIVVPNSSQFTAQVVHVVYITPVIVTVTLILGTFLWRSATPTGSGRPAARYGHSAVIYKKSLYVLLGQDTESDYNDVWTVNMKGMISMYVTTRNSVLSQSLCIWKDKSSPIAFDQVMRCGSCSCGHKILMINLLFWTTL